MKETAEDRFGEINRTLRTHWAERRLAAVSTASEDDSADESSAARSVSEAKK